MKLKYKKLVILITVVTLALSFFILTLIPTGGSDHSASDAKLLLNQDEKINKLIADYFAAKKDVDMEKLSTLVSDSNQIDKEKLVAMAEYVEDYQDMDCYVIKNEDEDAYRVYVKYAMKLKNIQTPAPCLSAFYVTSTSEGSYIIYLSALDEYHEEFISGADENTEIVKLKEEVAASLQDAIEQDAGFKQLYQKMDKEIQSASAKTPASCAAASAE